MRHITTLASMVLLITSWGLVSGCVIAAVETTGPRHKSAGNDFASDSDRELARLLVRLELRTRGVIAGHYVAADSTQRAWLAENLLLPAAVADKVFHEVVPANTRGRAWVRMVVDQPRNRHNTGDSTAVRLLDELRRGKNSAEQVTGKAYYYAEPITAKKTCLACHGEPKGTPDPFFPEYDKNGWREGQIVGAVVARVAPAS